MDAQKIEKLRELADKQVQTANAYAQARSESGEAEVDLKILLTAKLKELRGNKKNLGIEMAILMLCEDNEVARSLYETWLKKEAIYKGLEKILEAQASRLMWEMSVNKFIKEGEKYG